MGYTVFHLPTCGFTLSAEKIGGSEVTEVILGELPSVRPFEQVMSNKLPTVRPRGYLNSSITGNGNWFGTDGKDDQTGLMAAPDTLCDLPATCEHAGYLLMRQALNDKFTFSNRDYDRRNLLPAGIISIKKDIALTDQQVQKAQLLIEFIRARDVVSGANINWNKLSFADRQTAWQMMGDLPESATVVTLRELNTLAATGMGDYFHKNLVDANKAATAEGLWGKGALKDS